MKADEENRRMAGSPGPAEAAGWSGTGKNLTEWVEEPTGDAQELEMDGL